MYMGLEVSCIVYLTLAVCSKEDRRQIMAQKLMPQQSLKIAAGAHAAEPLTPSPRAATPGHETHHQLNVMDLRTADIPY